MTTPSITIFVRHSKGCKYEGEEFSRRCSCRKHFRWTQGGVQYRRKAGTRSWAEAEDNKRRLEDPTCRADSHGGRGSHSRRPSKHSSPKRK